MRTPTSYPFHGALPVDAQLDLMAAAKTPITAVDPLARVKAIEQATKRVKRNYPRFFKEQLNHENQT